MTHGSPEVKNHFRGDTLIKNTTEPSTSDVIILGEDAVSVPPSPSKAAYHLEKGFIGPLDATNEARGFIENKIKDLAKIAVLNFPLYDQHRANVIALATEAIKDGKLRFDGAFGAATIEDQVQQYVRTVMMESYEPFGPAAERLQHEKEEQRLGHHGQIRSMQVQINDARDRYEEQTHRIHDIRALLVEGQASEEFLQKFDYVTGLMSQPDREAYEKATADSAEDEVPSLVETEELALSDAFKGVVRHLAKAGLDLIGLHGPDSGIVTVVKRAEEVTR